MSLNIRGLSSSSKVQWPGAEEDEYINLRDIKGWATVMEIQAKCLVPDPDDSEKRIFDQNAFWCGLLNYMVVPGKDENGKKIPCWVIHQPDFEGKPQADLPDNPARYGADLVELIGEWLIARIDDRGFSVAPVIPEGRVDADGEPLTFSDPN